MTPTRAAPLCMHTRTPIVEHVFVLTSLAHFFHSGQFSQISGTAGMSRRIHGFPSELQPGEIQAMDMQMRGLGTSLPWGSKNPKSLAFIYFRPQGRYQHLRTWSPGVTCSARDHSGPYPGHISLPASKGHGVEGRSRLMQQLQ